MTSLTDHDLGDRDSPLLPTKDCLCDRLFVILRLLLLNFVSSGKFWMFVPVPELLTGDLTRLDLRRVALAVGALLTLHHRRNRVQWATEKLGWNLRTLRRIYLSDESRFLSRFTDGQCTCLASTSGGGDPFQDNVVAETETVRWRIRYGVGLL